MLKQNPSQTPTRARDTIFDENLPVGILFQSTQILQHFEATNIVGKNTRGYKKLQLSNIEAIKTSFQSCLYKTPSKPRSKGKRASSHNLFPYLTQTNILSNSISANSSTTSPFTKSAHEFQINCDLNLEPHFFIKPMVSNVIATIHVSHIYNTLLNSLINGPSRTNSEPQLANFEST